MKESDDESHAPWTDEQAVKEARLNAKRDLIESALKRRADTKDTGVLIPGIGGAFDLTDSLILTAPVAYFIFLFLD